MVSQRTRICGVFCVLSSPQVSRDQFSFGVSPASLDAAQQQQLQQQPPDFSGLAAQAGGLDNPFMDFAQIQQQAAATPSGGFQQQQRAAVTSSADTQQQIVGSTSNTDAIRSA